MAGHFSSQNSLIDSRLHGLSAVVLGGLITGLAITLPSGQTNAVRSYWNGAGSYAQVNKAGQPEGARAFFAARPPRARVFLFRTAFTVEAVLVGAWAGGLAYRRRIRRGEQERPSEEIRAA